MGVIRQCRHIVRQAKDNTPILMTGRRRAKAMIIEWGVGRSVEQVQWPGCRVEETGRPGGPRVCCRLVRELALAPDTMRKVDD